MFSEFVEIRISYYEDFIWCQHNLLAYENSIEFSPDECIIYVDIWCSDEIKDILESEGIFYTEL